MKKSKIVANFVRYKKNPELLLRHQNPCKIFVRNNFQKEATLSKRVFSIVFLQKKKKKNCRLERLQLTFTLASTLFAFAQMP